MTTAATDDLPVQPRSKLNTLSMLCFALTTAFLTASVILIFQYKLGIPFGFVTSVLLAAAAALVVPVVTGFLLRRYTSAMSYPGLAGFSIANLIIAIGTGLFIF